MRALPLLLALLLAGCAGARPLAPVRAAPAPDGLRVDFGTAAYLLRLPAFRWEPSAAPLPPAGPSPVHSPVHSPVREPAWVEAGGFRFACDDRLWVQDDGALREVSPPFRVRIGGAWARASGGCGSCLGGGLEILGVLFTPAGPDPGWRRMPLP